MVRDPAQSEEVTQEVMLEVWRTASCFDPHRGRATTWPWTYGALPAVDRVRSGLAAAEREARAAVAVTDYDVVAEEGGQPRRTPSACAAAWIPDRAATGIGHPRLLRRDHPEVAGLLGVAVGTVKTRMRDGLIRLRDCLGEGS